MDEAAATWVALAKGAFGLAIHVWPISVVVLVVALMALTIGAPFRDPAFRRYFPLMLVTYSFPLVVLVVGTVFRYDRTQNFSFYVEPPTLYGVVLWGVIAVHALSLVAGPIFMRGARVRSVAIVLPGFWLTLTSGFVAAVAIAGVGP